MQILGIDARALEPLEEPTQFENVIIPEQSFFFAGNSTFSFTQEYRETIDRIRDFAIKNRTPTHKDKIYYFYGRHQLGESRLAAYFKSKGYAIIRPERLTLDQQLNLMINCKSFASTLGSCSHNSIFTQDNTEVILIPRAAYSFTFYQQTLEQLHPMNSFYIDSSMSVFGKIHESYCFIISQQLKEFFGDKFYGYTKGDFDIFLEYFKEHGNLIEPRAKRYYRNVFPNFVAQLRRQKDLLTDCALPPALEKFIVARRG